MRFLSISKIGAFTDLAIGPSVLDYFAIRPSACSGGGGASKRVVEEDAPGDNGVLILPPLDGPRIITISGELIVTSVGASREPGYDDALDSLLASLKSAVEGLSVAAGDLVCDEGTLKVWQHGEFQETWDDLENICTVTFSLIVDVFA